MASPATDREGESVVLHASCVAWGPRAVLIRGPSGAGKSALALALMAHGCALVADDRTEVQVTARGAVRDRMGHGTGSGKEGAEDGGAEKREVRAGQTASRLLARCPPSILGLVEARGVGLLVADPQAEAEVILVADLDATEVERLPSWRQEAILGVALPVLQHPATGGFAPAVLQYLKGGRHTPRPPAGAERGSPTVAEASMVPDHSPTDTALAGARRAGSPRLGAPLAETGPEGTLAKASADPTAASGALSHPASDDWEQGFGAAGVATQGGASGAPLHPGDSGDPGAGPGHPPEPGALAPSEGSGAWGFRALHSLVLVTGPSGAGRSTAIRALEDLGFEVIDNLPLSLLPRLVEGPPLQRPLALGLDVRNRDWGADALAGLIDRLAGRPEVEAQVLYLDCPPEVLLRRYSETRRRHPLAPEGAPEAGIARERGLLAPIRARADVLIDTGALTPHDLRAAVESFFGPEEGRPLAVSVESFSYKQGLPLGLDIVMDCRFLRNPHWDEGLRHRDGRDGAVAAFVEADPAYGPFFARLRDLVLSLLPAYRAEGKAHLALGLGCTGGQHRSVAVAEALAKALAEDGWQVSKRHRELERRAGAATPLRRG